MTQPAGGETLNTNLDDDQDRDGLDGRGETVILGGQPMRHAVRPLLADPVLARLVLAAAVARLHVGGMGLCVLLLVEDATGSVARAGLAAGALSLGVGVTRPVQGRVLDRAGARGLALVAIAHALAALVLLAVVAAGAPGAGVAAAAFAVGFTTPALSVATRAICVRRVAPAQQPAVLGVDDALLNAAFMLGPLAGGALAALLDPPAAIGALLVVGCGGTLLVAALAPLPSRARPARTLARPALRPITRPLLASVAQGLVYGAVGVAGAAVVLAEGADHLAGPIVAALFGGGLVGNLVLAPRGSTTPLEQRLRGRTRALLAAVAIVCAAPTLPLLVAAVAACGAVLGSVGVAVLLDVARRAAPAARAEAFGWAGASLRLGDAVGAATAGVLAEQLGPRAGLLVALTGAACGVAVATAVRRVRLASAPA